MKNFFSKLLIPTLILMAVAGTTYAANVLKVPAGGTGMGAAVVNGVIYNGSSTTGPFANDSNFIWDPTPRVFYVGDPNGTGNGTLFSLSDASQSIVAQTSGDFAIVDTSGNGLFSIVPFSQFDMGDLSGAGNSTKLQIDDVGQTINLVAQSGGNGGQINASINGAYAFHTNGLNTYGFSAENAGMRIYSGLSNNWTWPTTYGAAGEALVDTNGAGALGWASTTISGTATHIPYFNALGALTSDTNFTRVAASQTTQIAAQVAGVGGQLDIAQNSVGFNYVTGGVAWGVNANNTGGGQLQLVANNVGWTWPNADVGGALISDGFGNLSFGQLPLTSGNIFVGSGGNLATGVAMSGDATISNTGVVSVDDSIKVYTTKVSLNSAQILDLNVTPQQLVAAPGAGKAIQVLDVAASYTFVTTAYDTNVTLEVYANLGSPAFTNTASLVDVGNSVRRFNNTFGNAFMSENTSVKIDVDTANPLNGDGTLDIYTTYKIITL